MKQEFTINLNQRKYPVTIEDHSFEKLGETLKGLLAGKRLAVITDRSVYDIYGKELEEQLSKTEKKNYGDNSTAGQGCKSLPYIT